MARSGGWKLFDSSSVKNRTYNKGTDLITPLALFEGNEGEFFEEQVEMSVDFEFFDAIKDRRPTGCKYRGLVLVHVNGFFVDVPSKTRCLILKLWIRFVKKQQ